MRSGVRCGNASSAGGYHHACFVSRRLGHPGSDHRTGARCGSAGARPVRRRAARHRNRLAHPRRDGFDRRDRARACRRSSSAPARCCAPPMSPPRCAAGARFLVSPGTTPELAASALATELPYLPGVATPSEVMTARALGICVMKLFPAEALGGDGFLRALAPVFAGVAFCPTGGIDEAQRRRIIWRCPTCRWSAARGWRRKTRSPPATGTASAASPNAPPRSAAPKPPSRRRLPQVTRPAGAGIDVFRDRWRAVVPRWRH